MAYELLKKIAAGPLPVTVTHRADIEKLRVLRDAGYVKVELPADGDEATSAMVLAVTPLGRTAMRYFGNG